MPCEIVFKTNVHSGGIIDYEHDDEEKDRRGVYKKGYPADALDDPESFRGFKEGLPYACSVHVTDASVAEVDAMIVSTFSGTRLIQPWDREIDFEVVNNNPVIDGWRIRVFATNPGFSNLAGITREMVENYLNRWNAVVVDATTNEVRFDVAIFENALNEPGAIQSNGFWGTDPVNVFFNEISYVEETGMHTLEVDYSLSTFEGDPILRHIDERGGVVISNISKVITFTIGRSFIFQWFQQEVKDAVEKRIYRRQFRIPEVTIDNIIANGTEILIDHYWDEEQTEFRGTVEYRVLDRTLAQIESFLINRLDEDL